MTRIEAKNIEMVAIEKIVANPKNRNVHPESQIEALAKIISASGFREPLIISKRSGFLIAGHGRLEAAKKIGMAELPVIRQDFESEAQEYQHMIADNEVARWATLDVQGLRSDLTEFDLDSFEIDMLGIDGFTVDDLNSIDVNNPYGEFDNEMGDTTSETEKSFGKIVVWFKSEKDFLDFKKRIDQNFTLGSGATTNSIWHPKK